MTAAKKPASTEVMRRADAEVGRRRTRDSLARSRLHQVRAEHIIRSAGLAAMQHPKAPVVLVVDDEALVRMTAADILTDCGATVLEAGDAEEALKILSEREDITLVFSDVKMPGTMDGLQLVEQVDELRPAIELILTSGRECFEKGKLPDDGTFLPKPYNVSELCGLVTSKLSPK